MRRDRWARTGLRDRLRAAFLAVGLVGIIGMGFVGYTFGRLLDARGRLADQLDPAGVETRRWVTSVVDQESGIRGYALTRDGTYLEPYEAGRRTAAEAEAAARRLLADERELLDLAEELSERSERWTTDAAEPLLADLQGGAGEAVVDADLRRSKATFDELRTAYRAFQDALDETRAEARRDLDQHTTDLAQAAAVAVLLAAAGLAATWVALNRWVIAPVDELAADARRVASGELRHEIAVEGPRDLEDLGGDVEAMRQRILWELAQVEDSRERLEEQAADLTRSNQELEQFAYVASHDLQEPLRKITGFCQLLQRRYGGQLDERADEYIAFAVDGAKRMQTLINDLLSFSRVGRTTETFQQVDLDPVAASAVATLQDAIAQVGATVEVDRLPTVEGDPGLLELLFQNLIGNALKFRGEAPPVVRISARRTDDPDRWELTCVDNGIGIEEAYAERVFVIFQRLHGRETYEGTGIGLAMCRKIVEFHGGRIWVDPQGGGPGATIRWTLATRLVHDHPEPLDPPAAAPIAPTADRSEEHA